MLFGATLKLYLIEHTDVREMCGIGDSKTHQLDGM